MCVICHILIVALLSFIFPMLHHITLRDIPTGYVDIFLSCFAVTAVMKYICCCLHDWM